MGNSFLVFVYGTLKRRHYNNMFLGNSIFIGEAITCRSLYMYSYGVPIVAIPFNSKTTVYALPIIGEVYSVSKNILRRLDVLEGHPDMYTRVLEEVQIENINKKAYIYIMSGEIYSLSEAEIICNDKEFQEGIKITDNKYEWVGFDHKYIESGVY